MTDNDGAGYAQALRADHVSLALGWIVQMPWVGESSESKANYLEEFAARNGPLTLETMLRLVSARYPAKAPAPLRAHEVLEPLSNEDFDALFAVAALGAILGTTGTEVARAALIPCLESSDVQVRWMAAIALARLRDERALPRLARMLAEFPPPDPRNQSSPFYGGWRMSLPEKVWEWGLPGAAAALRSGLVAALAAEARLPKPDTARPIRLGDELAAAKTLAAAESWFQYDNERLPSFQYQHKLVYGLGRVNALGALAGLAVPADVGYLGTRYGDHYIVTSAEAADHAERFRLNIWRVHAACASLESEYTYTKVSYWFAEVPAFKQRVERMLEDRFGLAEKERREALADYELVGGLRRWTDNVAKRQRAQPNAPPL